VNQKPSQLRVSVCVGPDATADDTAIASLRTDLIEVDGLKQIETITQSSNYAGPEATKSPTSLGVVGLTLTIAPLALKQVAAITRMWLDRQKARTITMEVNGEKLEISASSSSEQRAALDLFLERHNPNRNATEPGNE
jgi:hypothetical protein